MVRAGLSERERALGQRSEWLWGSTKLRAESPRQKMGGKVLETETNLGCSEKPKKTYVAEG